MALPLHLPFSPMEALSVDKIPTGTQWRYEPKWDGFRCLAFRDGEEIRVAVEIRSSDDPLFSGIGRGARLRSSRRKFVLDGEIVVPAGDAFSFDALLQRIHPAASRVRKFSAETPALLIAFDLLVGADGQLLTDEPLDARRELLEAFYRQILPWPRKRLRLSPSSTKLGEAKAWLRRSGATLDGVVAKRRDLAYRSGDRTGMQKIKNYRSADCVVGGFRYNEGTTVVGSLLLGPLRQRGLLASRRLHLDDQAAGQTRAHQKAQAVDRCPRLYRQCARRTEPLVDQALGRMGAIEAETRRRGLLRPFQRRSLQARHAAVALAPG